MTNFKDRHKETREILATLDKDGFAFEIIYGRRRIGKTELILNATKNRKRIYYLAIGENNLDRFYNLCVECIPEAGNLKKDYEVLLDYLKDKIEVLIIDEIQNIIIEDKNFLNLLQAVIDLKLKHSNLKFFILGSSVSLINSKVLSYKSPVYGRKTASLKLKSISFFEIGDFFPEANFEELINIYGFADGIPFYLVKIDREFFDWLGNQIKNEKGFLRDEVDFLMRYEFEDPGTYKLILQAIANGKNTVNEIKDFMALKRTDISSYLGNLIAVDFIKRVIPLTENIKSRKGRYYLNDNFLKFWYKFIYPNLSSIEQGIFKMSSLRKDYVAYLGTVFEDICRQYLVRSMSNSLSKIGKWWYKDKEIDIVAFNDAKSEAYFVECKWQENVEVWKILKTLDEKSKFVEWRNENRKEIFIIFAKSMKQKVKEYFGREVICIDLDDMTKILR